MSFVRQRHSFNSSIKQRLIQLRKLDNWHGIVALLYDYAVIAAAVYLFLLTPWAYPLSAVLIGSRQRALATVLHESAHKCLAKSPRLNKFLGTYPSGYLILQEYNIYVDTHVKKHHGYLGDSNRDPDFKYHQEQGLYDTGNKRSFLYQFIIKPLLLLKSASYLNYLIRNRLLPDARFKKSFYVMISYWLVILAGCYHYGILHLVALLWFIPLFTTASVFGWFNELSEHFPLTPDRPLDIHMSRNRFSTLIEHFLCNTHNENYHLIHHLYPTIPFWNLPKAHQVLLEDEAYAKANENASGIFISTNKNPSVLKHILSHLPQTSRAGLSYE